MSNPIRPTRRALLAGLLSGLAALIFGWPAASAAAPPGGECPVTAPLPPAEDDCTTTFYEYGANDQFPDHHEPETNLKVVTYDAANRQTQVKWRDA